jgi:hypothetical protein
LFIDSSLVHKNYGFVVPDVIEYLDEDNEYKRFELKPIKVWGIKNLNRCFHLDKVLVKFTNWAEWGTSGLKITQNVDFNDFDKFMEFG